ncbi:MAG: hypothetical protein FWC27_09575 [Firmicutes bacterium]|nr:hypothetical protein [Bacillota bacterium]
MSENIGIADEWEKVLEAYEGLKLDEDKEAFSRRLANLAASVQEESVDREHKLCALLFCKSAFVNAGYLDCFDPKKDDPEALPENYRSFAALGSSADCIQLHRLQYEKGQLLQAVFRENARLSRHLDGSVFVNPQYVVYSYRRQSKEERSYNDFWDNDTSPDNFFFVTTVNIASPNISYQERLEMRQNLSDEILKLRLISGGRFRYLLCETLDVLSDCVILWRSKNIRPVIEILHILFQNSALGLAHNRTVCSVPVDRLRDKEKYRGLLDSVGRTSSVDSMALRAVSNDGGKLEELKEQMLKLEEMNLSLPNDRGKHSFVLGNTDYIGSFRGIDDVTLCAYLRELIVLLENEQLQGAVVRLETDIGIEGLRDELAEYEDKTKKVPLAKPDNPVKAALMDTSEKLLLDMKTLFKNKKDIFSDDYAPWKNSVLELCNMLLQMSRSCIYDSASFLLIDSIQLFCDWLQKNVADGPCPRRHLLHCADDIHRYINSWVQLADIIARTGGTVSHMPGYSPLLYHMSTSVLELCQAYFSETARFIRRCGGEDDDISCILVPAQSKRIATGELIKGEKLVDRERWILGKDCSMLVHIEVPLELLSKPLSIATTLTHEIGHHYGLRKFSEREKRRSAYAKALGIALDGYLELEQGDVQWIPSFDPAEDDRWPQVCRSCVRHIEDQLKMMRQDEKWSGKWEKIMRLLLTKSFYSEIIRDLFDETFCDVLMLTLLGGECDMSTYVKSIYMQPTELALQQWPDPEATIMRIYLAATICKSGEGDDRCYADWLNDLSEEKEKLEDGNPEKNFVRKLRNGFEVLSNPGSERDMDRYYPEPLLKVIKDYLGPCRKIIETAIGENDGKLHRIRADYRAIKNGRFLTHPFYDLIYRYRKAVLEPPNYCFVDDV